MEVLCIFKWESMSNMKKNYQYLDCREVRAD